MSEQSQNKLPFKLKPEEYQELLSATELENISLINWHVQLLCKEFPQCGQVLKIGVKSENSIISDEKATIHHTYTLDVKGEKNGTKTLKITATYLLEFSSSKRLSNDFFEVYNNVSLHTTIWPFFRELVSNSTARLNIPPLTIPLLKSL